MVYFFSLPLSIVGIGNSHLIKGKSDIHEVQCNIWIFSCFFFLFFLATKILQS